MCQRISERENHIMLPSHKDVAYACPDEHQQSCTLHPSKARYRFIGTFIKLQEIGNVFAYALCLTVQ